MRRNAEGSGETGRAEIVELERAEALALLASVDVGRVVFSHEALPAVRPVTFVLVDSAVVFRVSHDSTLARTLRGNVVAFEADDLDRGCRTGWSVVVTGLAELVEPGTEHDRITGALPEPWAPGVHDRVVRIQAQLVSGRRIRRIGGNAPGGDGCQTPVGPVSG